MFIGNDEFAAAQVEDFFEGDNDAEIAGYAAAEGDGRDYFFSLAEAALEVAGESEAKPGDDVVDRGGLLLEVDHIALGEDAASTGDARGSGAF